MEQFDWQLIINPNILSLKVVGLWPKDNEVYKCDLYSLYALSAACVILGGHNLSQIINIFYVYSDLTALTEIIFISITNFLATAKIYVFVRNMGLIKQVFTTLNTYQFRPKTLEQVSLATEPLKSWRMFYFCYVSFVYVIIVTWCITPVLIDETKIYRLPFEAWYPFNVKRSPIYEMTYFYQLVCIWPITIANINLDTLIFAFMVYMRAQCDLLCDDLEKLADDGFYNTKLIRCIKHHKAIVSFAKTSNNFFNMIVLGQIVTSTAVLALTMFELSLVNPLSGKGIGHLLYITGLTAQILFYCKYGNEVELRSAEIVYAIYKSDWFGLPEEVKRSMLILCIRCQKPIKITAINLFTLSLQTFIAIFRSAWSYFAVLHHVNDEP